MQYDGAPQIDAALREVVQGVEAEIGDPFFQSLVRHLASALSVNYAFVSELTHGGTRFRTRALWGRGGFMQNIDVPLDGTPCEAVLLGEISHHARDLCDLFPRDVALRDWGAVSYCGVPLVSSSGAVVGHFAIIDGKPMPDGSLAIAVMRIFAARARAELDRLHAEEALRASEERLARVLDSAMDAIVTFDEVHRIELFNDAATKVFRCNDSEAVGSSLDRFLGDGLRALIQSSCAAICRGGGARRYFLAPEGLTARRADGSEFPIEATLSHVRVDGRDLFTLILRDFDELHRAERELQRVSLHNEYLEEQIKSVHNFEEIVGRSPALSDTLEKVRLVAGTSSSVLILGETGTGKELIARAVHSASARKERAFVKVNCAALPPGLIESELFGHERGAFTGATQRRIGRFELANGGTIFLDEIGDLPLDVQAKLLRVLQEGQFERVGAQSTLEVDVRVITATNRDLAQAVSKGSFRADLYYRLNVFPVEVPALRDRREDVPLLVQYFLARYAAKVGRKALRVSERTMARLTSYDWPGNVRELENVVERAVILADGEDPEMQPELLGLPGASTAADVAAGMAYDATAYAPGGAAPAPRASEQTRNGQHSRNGGDDTADGNGDLTGGAMKLADFERHHIESALERAGGRIEGAQGAARLLGLNPSTLRSRMKKLGIQRAPQRA